jgi:hypothetical protein
MADVMVGYPERALPSRSKPCGETFEKISKILKGWTHSYDGYEWSGAASSSVYVGEDVERSYVKLDELAKHEDMFPKECINLW